MGYIGEIDGRNRGDRAAHVLHVQPQLVAAARVRGEPPG